MKAKFLLVFLFAILFQVNIPSTSEQKGKYTLEIQLPTEVFSGEFELEN